MEGVDVAGVGGWWEGWGVFCMRRYWDLCLAWGTGVHLTCYIDLVG